RGTCEPLTNPGRFTLSTRPRRPASTWVASPRRTDRAGAGNSTTSGTGWPPLLLLHPSCPNLATLHLVEAPTPTLRGRTTSGEHCNSRAGTACQRDALHLQRPGV